MITWVLLLFMSVSQTGINGITIPQQPIVITGYTSEETCMFAYGVAVQRFKTDWRAVWGSCIPGPMSKQ